MSHVKTISCEISDLEILKKVCNDLGLTFNENQKTYKWFGRWVNDYHGKDAAYKNGVDPKTFGTCEHEIVVPDSAYSIGLIKNKDTGTFTLIYDFWGNDGHVIKEKVGHNCEAIVQGYAVEMVKKNVQKLINSGFRNVTNKKMDNGTVVLSYVRG